jgi:hypothetical protein
MSSLTPKLDLFFRNIDKEYMNLWYRLWWQYIPGVTVTVRWPRGPVRVGPSHREGWSGVGEYFEYIDSADPNDHYRPYMEQHIGRQGWDWDWQIDDIANDTLKIKIRRRHAKYATIIGMKWA